MIGPKGKSGTVRERISNAARQGFLAALDIGSHKIACFVARIEPGKHAAGTSSLKVVGIGHQPSRGVRNGQIVDMERVDTAIRAAVDAAERMADVTVRDVILNISCGQPHSQTFRVEAQLSGREVQDSDVKRLLNLGRMEAERPGRVTIHASPIAYSLDQTPKVRDPRGMCGERLSASMHSVSVHEASLQNLEMCVERCHLGIAARVATPYASGLASLVSDEMELGATVIDMGAGTTSIAVFAEGSLVYTDLVPLGGFSITSDIARGLSTPLSHAERMKTLYGSALVSPSDDRETVRVPQVGEEDPDAFSEIPRSHLTGIIRPRVEEIFELVRDRLAAAGADQVAGRRVVLTGGASQLSGAREMAQRVLSKQARLGRPIRLHGLAEATNGPAFATTAGLLAYAQLNPLEALDSVEPRLPESASRLPWQRFSQWIKENL